MRSVAPEPTPVITTVRETSRGRALPGALARLQSEDWHEMTAAANNSPEHVGNLARWVRRARELNPRLTDEQATRLARELKAQYYRELSTAGVMARRARASA